jgi:hypothetical protein
MGHSCTVHVLQQAPHKYCACGCASGVADDRNPSPSILRESLRDVECGGKASKESLIFDIKQSWSFREFFVCRKGKKQGKKKFSSPQITHDKSCRAL